MEYKIVIGTSEQAGARYGARAWDYPYTLLIFRDGEVIQVDGYTSLKQAIEDASHNTCPTTIL